MLFTIKIQSQRLVENTSFSSSGRTTTHICVFECSPSPLLTICNDKESNVCGCMVQNHHHQALRKLLVEHFTHKAPHLPQGFSYFCCLFEHLLECLLEHNGVSVCLITSPFIICLQGQEQHFDVVHYMMKSVPCQHYFLASSFR